MVFSRKLLAVGTGQHQQVGYHARHTPRFAQRRVERFLVETVTRYQVEVALYRRQRRAQLV